MTSKSTDPVVRSDTTDGTPDSDPGFNSDMMAKPQSVVKLRRFGAFLNEMVCEFGLHYTLVAMFSEQALEIEMCSPENVAAEERCKLVENIHQTLVSDTARRCSSW